MVNEIKRVIKDYLKYDNTNYAIMITGKWGSGKTYYWENTLTKEISETTEVHVLYVSINGLSSIEDLSRKLLLAILKQKHGDLLEKKHEQLAMNFMKIFKPIAENISMLKAAVQSFFGKFSGLMNVDLKTSGLLELYDFSKYVVCIDDVERYHGDIEEFMGFCNHLMEQQHSHLVLIANEEIIEKKKENTYRTIKEKVIGKTLQFNMHSSDVIRDIMEDFKSRFPDAYGFLFGNLEICIHAVDYSESKNYRVVAAVLNDFCYLFNRIRQMGDLNLTDSEQNTAEKALLKFMLAAGLEIHANKISAENIKELRGIASASLKELIAAAAGKNQNPVEYFSSFKKRYYNEWCSEREFFPSTIDYLTKGCINENKLKEEIERFHDKEWNVYDYILSLGFWKMSDEFFERNVKGVLLNEIASGKVPVQFYQTLFLHCAKFVEMGLMGITIPELEEKFCLGLDAIGDNGCRELPADDSSSVFVHEQISELTSTSQEAFHRVHNKIAQILDGLKRKRSEADSLYFVEQMEHDFENALKLPFPGSREKYINGALFLNAHPDDVYNILEKQSNKNIIDFRNMLINRHDHSTAEALQKDAPFLSELADLIKSRNSELPEKKLSQALLLQLADDIKRIVEQKQGSPAD